MKQLLFCYKYNRILKVRHNVLTDVFVPTQDVISPQKTTLIVPKTDKIEQSDIIIIRDNDSNKIEYIGYIDTITNKFNTEIACYPLINVFDNDFVLDQMFKKGTNEDGSTSDIDVDVVEWLSNQISRAFITTNDSLQSLPFIIRNMTSSVILNKKVIDTSNLLEVYTDLFIEKGVYIEFNELEYSGNFITGIYCDIYCNNDRNPYKLRYDNPSIQEVNIVDNTFTNYNKIIATEELEDDSTREPQRYYFYLLNNNSVTTDVNDTRRIKQVRSKEITFRIKTVDNNGEEVPSAEETAKSLLLAVQNELQAPEYNLQITITMFYNDNIRLYRNVEFTDNNNVVYTTNITKLEILNDKQVKIVLGALRNSLTDFKKKVEVI